MGSKGKGFVVPDKQAFSEIRLASDTPSSKSPVPPKVKLNQQKTNLVKEVFPPKREAVEGLDDKKPWITPLVGVVAVVFAVVVATLALTLTDESFCGSSVADEEARAEIAAALSINNGNLDISGIELRCIPANVFDAASPEQKQLVAEANLNSLSIGDIGLEKISPLAFKGFPGSAARIEEIFQEGSKALRLPNKLLEDFTELTGFSFTGPGCEFNNLVNPGRLILETGVFGDNPKVEKIILTATPLLVKVPLLVKTLSALKILNLASNCKLENVAKDLFRGLEDLIEIDISDTIVGAAQDSVDKFIKKSGLDKLQNLPLIKF